MAKRSRSICISGVGQSSTLHRRRCGSVKTRFRPNNIMPLGGHCRRITTINVRHSRGNCSAEGRRWGGRPGVSWLPRPLLGSFSPANECRPLPAVAFLSEAVRRHACLRFTSNSESSANGRLLLPLQLQGRSFTCSKSRFQFTISKPSEREIGRVHGRVTILARTAISLISLPGCAVAQRMFVSRMSLPILMTEEMEVLRN